MSPLESQAISPELALVDPDLAAAERELLPRPLEFRPGWRTRAGSPAVVLAEAQPEARVEVEVEEEGVEVEGWELEPELPLEEALWAAAVRTRRQRPAPLAEEPRTEEPRVGTTLGLLPRPLDERLTESVRVFRTPGRRRRVLATRLALVGVAGAAAGVAVADQGTLRTPTSALVDAAVVEGSGSAAVPTQPARSTPHVATTAPHARAPAPHSSVPKTAAPHSTTPHSATPHSTAPHSTTPHAATTTTAAPRPPTATRAPKRTAPKPKSKPKPKASVGASSASSGFTPSRVWAWAPVTGADAYRVSFRRGGRVVFTRRTGASQVQLPASFVFRPGRYEWTVIPIVSGRPRQAVVRSIFTVK